VEHVKFIKGDFIIGFSKGDIRKVLIPIRFQTLNKYTILTSSYGGFYLGYILVLDGELI